MCQENNDLLVHYNSCGHEIHPACSHDVKVCLVCSCLEANMIERQLDILRKIKPELYSKECEIMELPNI